MITIGYSTKETKPEFKKHLLKTCGLDPKKVQIIEIINVGDKSLTKCYNDIIDASNNDIVIFTHDDVLIETTQWGKKMLKLFQDNEDFGIIGVAGSKFLPSEGKWWLNPKTMFGKVKHTNDNKSWLSEYSNDLGNTLEEVVVTDGVFFGVHTNRIHYRDNKAFNEAIEGFHFYDVEFSFHNYIMKKSKVGVTTKVRINHFSIGQTNDQWEENRRIFIDIYKDNLPQYIDETFHKKRLKIMYVDTNENQNLDETFKIVNELKKNNCDVSLVSNFTPQDIKNGVNNNIKLYHIQEPPFFKLGDGISKINTKDGPFITEKGKYYKMGLSNFDIIYSDNENVLKSYKLMYPECYTFDNVITNDNILDELIKFYNESTINQYINENIEQT